MNVAGARLGETRADPAPAWRSWLGQLRFLAFLFRRNPLSVAGLAITVLLILMAIFAPWLATHDPLQPNAAAANMPPSSQHWFGTDTSGFDIYSRVIYAARIDLFIAVVGVLFAATIGTALGGITGYFGGTVDFLVMRLLDSLQAFPSYILALAIVPVVGQRMSNLILVLAVVNFPIYARLVRATMLQARELQYADAARCVGNPPLRVIFRHLLPNCMGPVWVNSSINAGWALLLAASLSFIGLGIRVPTPEWGLMVSMGARGIVFGDWWISFFPGAAIFLAVLGFNLLGDGLQDIFDPKRR